MSVKVYDYDTKQWIETSEEEASSLLRTPRYGVAKGQYNLVGESGDTFSVDSKDLYEYLSNSAYRLERPDEKQYRVLQDEYGGTAGMAGAAVAGAARGISLGLSDLALQATPWADDVKRLYEANPNISLTGELAGVGAATLLTGGLGGTAAGASAGARGAAVGAARLATAPARAAIKGGQAVTRATTAALKGVKGWEKSAAILGRAAGAAAEGATFGAGTALSETVLGDADLSAEEVLTNLATGAAVGGVAGGVLSFGVDGLKALKSKVLRELPADHEATRRLIEDHTGESIPKSFYRKHVLPKSKEKAAKIISTMSGKPGEVDEIRRLLDMDAATRALAVEEVGKAANNHAVKLKKSLDAVESAYNVAVKRTTGKGKLRRLDTLLPKGEADAAVTWTKANQLMQDLEGGLEELIERGDLPTSKANILRRYFNQTRERVASAPTSFQNLFEEMDLLATKMQDEVRKAGGFRDQLTMSQQDIATADSLKAAQKQVDDFIAESFGEAGQVRKELNILAADDIGASKRMEKEYFQQRERAGFTEKLADDNKLRAYVKGIHDSDVAVKADNWDHFVKARRQRLQRNMEVLDLDPETLRAHKDALDSLLDLEKNLTLAQTQMRQIRVLKAVEKNFTGFGAIQGAVFGGMAESLLTGDQTGLGATIGFLGGVLSKPGQAARLLAAIRVKKAGTEALVDKAAKELVTPKQGAINRNFVERGVRAAAVTTQTRDNIRQRREDYGRAKRVQELVDNLSPVLTDPGFAMEKFREEFAGYEEVAPQLTQEIGALRVRAAAYLLEKARQLRVVQPGRRVTMSHSKLAQFETFANAVNNPGRVLQKIGAGVANSQEIEALKEVYPRLYANLSAAVGEQLSQAPGDLDPRTRNQLALLFGEDASGLHQRAMVNRLQGVHAVAGGQPNEQGVVQSGRPQTQGQRNQVLREFQTSSERIEYK